MKCIDKILLSIFMLFISGACIYLSNESYKLNHVFISYAIIFMCGIIDGILYSVIMRIQK